jgi:hypothetical protein
MTEVSKKTLDTFFPLGTEAVGAFRYLVWPERAPSRQKRDRRETELPWLTFCSPLRAREAHSIY